MRRARTIRLRLTLIYSGVFLVSTRGAADARLPARPPQPRRTTAASATEVDGLGAGSLPAALRQAPLPPNASIRAFQAGYHQAVNATLHRLLLEYVGALVAMTGVSVALGWWMAGRALSPLRRITATARRVSGENLGERIALQGPEDELKELADTFDGMLRRGSTARSPARSTLSPTRRMSCAPRWRSCAPRSTSPLPTPTRASASFGRWGRRYAR